MPGSNCKRMVALVTAALILISTTPSAYSDSTDVVRQRNWCYTQILFEEKKAESGSALSPEACALQGDCDQAATRDGFSPSEETPIVYLRLYFHVLTQDDGSFPATTAENVASQVDVLNEDYLPHRIQFEYDMRFVADSDFRVLDQQYEFDQMKDLYALDPTQQINIYVARVDIGGEVYSFGTFPWDFDALGNRGGVVMNYSQFYPYEPHTLTHELGHNLGLYHTFRGVSEVAQCGSCYESPGVQDPDYRGDLCSDTPPTPLNYYCSAPGGSDPCTGFGWGVTAPENYMSYAPSYCQTEFTPQQAGRMHCWIQDELASWIIDFELLADQALGQPPMTVNFQGVSDRTTTSWTWDFGDGDVGSGPAPSHEYLGPGYYTVGATIETPNGPYSTAYPGLVSVYADTLWVDDATIKDGRAIVDVNVRNYVPLTDLFLPISWDGTLDIDFDSGSVVGLRTEHMVKSLQSVVPQWKVATLHIYSGSGGALEPGEGTVLRLYFDDQSGGATGETTIAVEDYLSYSLEFVTPAGSYAPVKYDGIVSKSCCQGIVGDANNDRGPQPTIGDISALIDHLFITQASLACYPEADINQSGGLDPTSADITIGDISLLIDHLFINGTPLGECL